MSDIDDIAKVIEDLHGCKPTYVETVPVLESFQGQTVWEGDVEVFELQNHPQAERVYAWAHYTGETGEAKRYVTVLAIPPATTPQAAVKAAIIQEYREREKET